MKRISILITVCNLLLALNFAGAQDNDGFPAYGSDAPGLIKCKLSYLVHDPSRPRDFAGRGQDFFVEPKEFEGDGKFTYIYRGAKVTGISKKDENVQYRMGLQINGDGFTRANLYLERVVPTGDPQTMASIAAAWHTGTDLTLTFPNPGFKVKNLDVLQVQVDCWEPSDPAAVLDPSKKPPGQ